MLMGPLLDMWIAAITQQFVTYLMGRVNALVGAHGLYGD
jgi:hypothetical protein